MASKRSSTCWRRCTASSSTHSREAVGRVRLPRGGAADDHSVVGLFGTGPVRPGEPAPDFELVDQKGERVKLAELRGTANIVVFFYPKDDTPVCTKEACLFRDNYAAMRDADAIVLGISSDPPSSHRAFAEKNGVTFPLLSDETGEVRKAFGVPNTLGVLPGRVTFVIDKGGIVRHVTSNQLSATKHVDEALAALARLSG